MDLNNVRSTVLRHATQYVQSAGLSLSISETLVAQLAEDSGVSARQFAQVWQRPEDFLVDLFCELANEAQIDRADSQTLLTAWQYLSMRSEELRSPAGRRRLLLDIIRTAAEYNFDVVTASNKWRTYAALSTTIMSWPDVGSRTRVLDALRASELAFVETMESFYRNVIPTVGYRLKAEFHGDYQSFVIATASIIEGLGIVRSTVPAIVEAHFSVPFEDGKREVWSVAALSFMGVVDAFIEPDPNFEPGEAISRLSTGIDVTPPSESRQD